MRQQSNWSNFKNAIEFIHDRAVSIYLARTDDFSPIKDYRMMAEAYGAASKEIGFRECRDGLVLAASYRHPDVQVDITGETDLEGLKERFGQALIQDKLATRIDNRSYRHCWHNRPVQEVSLGKLQNAHASKMSDSDVNYAALLENIRCRHDFEYSFTAHEDTDKYQGKISVSGSTKVVSIKASYTTSDADSLDRLVEK